ncbi:MAG: heavy-metal-associated domain-containing protein [Burkholderiaceae bacterium]|nr:MAG: heavy-metal-associated domain-containing protein [Burkholderiaceae bacterium]
MLKSLGFTITGEPRLHCASCEERVVRTLRRLDGVRDVRASAASQRVEIMIDAARLGVKDVVEHLSLLGYRAQPDAPVSPPTDGHERG